MPDDRIRDADIGAIVEQLRAELRIEPNRLSAADQAAAVQLHSRRELDRLWRVTAERPFLRRPGAWGFVYGALVLPLKWVLRRLMRWYVEPMAADQRAFNAAVMRVVDEQLEWMQGELSRLERLVQDSDSQPRAR
jgi:hypothetical protein